jgi:hypothetical protein
VVPLLNKDELKDPHDDPEQWVRYVYTALEVAERFLDGQATEQELWGAGLPTYFDFSTDTVVWAINAAFASCHVEGAKLAAHAAAAAHQATDAHREATRCADRDNREALEHAAQATALRDIFGSLPFRALPALADGVLAWNDSCIVKLAASIYDERDFSDERMGILADALEEAGVAAEEVLGHCRQQGAVHVRGCWLVDLLIGKE